MKLRSKKEKKGAVKKELKEVELNVEELFCELSLQDITKIEVNEMLRRMGLVDTTRNYTEAELKAINPGLKDYLNYIKQTQGGK